MAAAGIDAIAYALPERTESVEELVEAFPAWSADSVVKKTGIRRRHIAGEDECASDLGVAAARSLLEKNGTATETIDYLIFCTQTPDYLAPATACLVQQRLGLGTHTGALDINQGCSGYVYSLGVAQALIEAGQAQRLLLITADTYSKFVNPGDRGVRAVFGDGATATLLSRHSSEDIPAIGPFVYGTDGGGAEKLIVPSSAMRAPPTPSTRWEYTDERGNTRSAQNIYMDGRGVVEFTLREAPRAVLAVCAKAGVALDTVDVVVPHQASALVLDGIRERLGLTQARFLVDMEETGNTVSSSIPIALANAARSGRIKPGMRVLLIGFGIGLSWGAALVRLPPDFATGATDEVPLRAPPINSPG
jgi:3-oxoacyl-[acyl-carrier-protein] synthase-3